MPPEEQVVLWNDVKRHKPRLTAAQRQPGSFGIQVLIWPHHKSEGSADSPVAFYGCRCSDKPAFYLHGRVIDVEYFMYLPYGPVK